MGQNGFTPLYHAARNGHAAVVGQLLSNKANPDRADQVRCGEGWNLFDVGRGGTWGWRSDEREAELFSMCRFECLLLHAPRVTHIRDRRMLPCCPRYESGAVLSRVH